VSLKVFNQLALAGRKLLLLLLREIAVVGQFYPRGADEKVSNYDYHVKGAKFLIPLLTVYFSMVILVPPKMLFK